MTDLTAMEQASSPAASNQVHPAPGNLTRVRSDAASLAQDASTQGLQVSGTAISVPQLSLPAAGAGSQPSWAAGAATARPAAAGGFDSPAMNWGGAGRHRRGASDDGMDASAMGEGSTPAARYYLQASFIYQEALSIGVRLGEALGRCQVLT